MNDSFVRCHKEYYSLRWDCDWGRLINRLLTGSVGSNAFRANRFCGITNQWDGIDVVGL